MPPIWNETNNRGAVRQCRQVTQLAPDLSDAHLALAIIYCNLEEYANCESELDIALRLDPASSKALQSRAVELFYRNRLEEAIPWFRRAIEAGPATIDLYLDLGISLELIWHRSEARERYRQGVTLANRELEKNPANGFVKAELALLCARLDQRDRAESEAGQARRFAAGSVEIAKLLARTYEVLGKRTDALELVQNMPGDALKLRISRRTWRACAGTLAFIN